MSILGCRFFPFHHFTLPFPFDLQFLLKNQQIALWEFPCMLFVAFHLLLLVFFCLYLIFIILITMCFGCMWLCASWTLITVSFPRLGSFSAIISSYCLGPVLPLISFLCPYNVKKTIKRTQQ